MLGPLQTGLYETPCHCMRQLAYSALEKVLVRRDDDGATEDLWR
jgi:hypothetical protein